MHSDLAFDDADLHGLVDGRLDPARAAALSDSLASDPDVCARLDAWRRQNDSLRTMFSAVLFEPVPVRLLPLVMPPRDRAASLFTLKGFGARPSGVLATIAIGSALVGFALGALTSLGTDGFGLAQARGSAPSLDATSGARDLASRAVDAHRTFIDDLVRPGETASGEAPKLARWVERRLGSGVRLPDLARQGWSFVGANIVPGRHGPAAFLAYAKASDRLGLTVSREPLSGEEAVLVLDRDTSPLAVATWGDGAFSYAFTSDRGRAWLARSLAPLRGGVTAQLPADDDGDASP